VGPNNREGPSRSRGHEDPMFQEMVWMSSGPHIVP
jgi:hypothetical protein